MRLQILLTTIVQVVVVESLREVTGYLGDNVTLHSKVDRSLSLSKIEWSVFSNNTWIATYRDGKLNIKRFHRYIGRLSLDISSGDLIIHNLNTEDEREYRVELITTEGKNIVHKISLTVRERLKPPTIQLTAHGFKGGCLVELRCSSPDNGVNISWQDEPPNVTAYFKGDHADLLVFLNSTENNVKFTCTASNHVQNATNDIIPKCNDEKPTPGPQPGRHPESRCTYAPVFFPGFFLGGLLAAVLTYWFREKIKVALDYIKAKLFPSKSS